jgi:hypothetical protein
LTLPPALSRLFGNLFPTLGGQALSSSLPALPAQRDRTGVFPIIWRGAFLNLACCDLADHDGGSDYVGWALFAFWSSWHWDKLMLSGKLGKFVGKIGEAPMDDKLVAACQMFLVPATILFAALGVATTEALKTLLCFIGVVVSTAWLYRLYRWTGLSDTDRYTAFALAYMFFAAAFIAAVVHFRLWRKEWGKTWTGFINSLR